MNIRVYACVAVLANFGQPEVWPSGILSISFETRSVIGLDLTNYARMAGM